MPNRTEMLHFRATPEEKARIEAGAKRAALDLSEYVRRELLNGSWRAAAFAEVVEKGRPYEVAPTQPAVEEYRKLPIADLPPETPSETYEQLMERRVGELSADEAGPDEVAGAREKAYAEWIGRKL